MVVRLLRGRDITMRALVRDGSRALAARESGVTPVVLNLFDEDQVAAAAEGSDAILHLATRIPPLSQWRYESAWLENDRIRREGAWILGRVARRVSAEAFVYPSVTLVYPDRGSEWIDAARVPPEQTILTESTLDAEHEVERFAGHGRRGITLRLGALYGPQSGQSQHILEIARRGLSPFIAHDDAYHPFTWIDDAAAAVVAALHGVPSGTYDIVDDDPLTVGQIRHTLAQAVGRRRVRRLPRWLLRFSLGAEVTKLGQASRRVSNAAFKWRAAWTPSVASARQGWQLIARELLRPRG